MAKVVEIVGINCHEYHFQWNETKTLTEGNNWWILLKKLPIALLLAQFDAKMAKN
jgi:hypothetical protein